MDDPGISTSPIALISGESEFCQTFFDNVKVPKENLVGELNKGWSVAKALLVHERKLMSEMGSDSPREALVPSAAAHEYLEFVDGKIADGGLRIEARADLLTQIEKGAGEEITALPIRIFPVALAPSPRGGPVGRVDVGTFSHLLEPQR